MKRVNVKRGGVTAALASLLVVAVAVPAFAAVNFLLVASTPNVGSGHNDLHAVAVVSATQMYAVGETFNGSWDQGLILTGNGTTWSARVAPTPAHSTHNVLNAVAMVSRSLGYAVGTYSIGTHSYNLVEKFVSGSWSLRTVSNPTGAVASQFDGIATGSSKSVMAVGGSHAFGRPYQPVAAFFNGTSWKYVTPPNPGHIGTSFHAAELFSVTVVPGSLGKKFWAVGTYSNGAHSFPFFDYWNGLSWKQYGLAKSVQVVTSSLGPVSSVITSVTTIAANNAWAVGYYLDTHTPPTPSNERTFTVHWNGSNWSMMATPNRVSNATPNELVAVASRGPHAIYAVGRYFAGPADQTQALFWDTALVPPAWAKITSASHTTDHNSLEGLAMVPISGAVSVGTYYNGTSDRTLILSCSSC